MPKNKLAKELWLGILGATAKSGMVATTRMEEMAKRMEACLLTSHSSETRRNRYEPGIITAPAHAVID
ncbi:MAG TPA: hypothetical protein VGS02_03405 [Acidobacteriaceae bacterium]|nr:hypothetical protein [Acidobacteriaceae bacterium]